MLACRARVDVRSVAARHRQCRPKPRRPRLLLGRRPLAQLGIRADGSEFVLTGAQTVYEAIDWARDVLVNLTFRSRDGPRS